MDVIDGEKLLAATKGQHVKVQRWRVNDNLPGTRHFCPSIVLTEEIALAGQLNVAELLTELTNEFGEDMLMRAAAWMTLRESKASFAIEGEADRISRVQRFANVMAQRTGQGPIPLCEKELTKLQQDILGERSTLTHFGLRQSPVFVGETVLYDEIVHYIAPPANDVADMLEGLREFLTRTVGQAPVVRCAVAAFGFIYIHPLADGNGRIHRFLINDILRRDGVVPASVILPISAVITDDAGERRSYDQVLDEVSAALMQQVRDEVVFEPTQTRYEDGVVSNLAFHGDDKARPLWRYPKLGPHVIYLANILRRTVTEQMREESRYLRNHARARDALKEIIEMPDHQADRVLRSIEQNQGALSNVLAKEIPILRQPGVWSEIVEAVMNAFKADVPINNTVIDRYRK